ncbi:MAG TPA: hypothetical protein VGJ70_09200 [Solirubrobacteraceae bacterium]|jgi:hypothetical protein
MQVVDNSMREREPRAPDPLRPGLDVAVLTLASDSVAPDIHLSIRGGAGPVRLYLYVDGDLRESLTSSSERFRVALEGLGAGRHAVTARAIDATGRWGGASIVIGIPLSEEPSSAQP